MTTLRTFALAGVLVSTLAACAQPPLTIGQDGRPGPQVRGMAHGMSHDHMAMMDAHMKKMREMHEKMSGARTPEERNALMAEHMKLMHEGMAMMGGMGAQAGTGAPMDMQARQQMMEKHMEMMRSMMQMMMDRMQSQAPQPPADK